MADALKEGEIDAFCVGEPWGSMAVENGVGTLLLPGNAIWKFAPEKVLAVRSDWAAAEPDLLGRLIRATWRAGRWLSEPGAPTLAAELLSRKEYLDLPPEILDRALTGRMVISSQGEERSVERFVEFHRGAANFPWRSQAEWIGMQLAARTGLDRTAAARAARGVFRSDLYREALGPTRADLPGASSKMEGALSEETAVASVGGRLFLGPDSFFDGRIFEPSRN
jgi:two-component system, oxyanion-binding sensor